MKHTIPIENLGPMGEFMANAVEKCVHCGFCLPACPTYSVLGDEMDSPRGRIILMKSVLEGSIDLEDALVYVDHCLGCLGCVTACPSGVPYGELITPFRGYAENIRQRTPMERLSRRLTRETLPYPSRFRLAAQVGNLAKPVRKMLPKQFEAMLALVPESLPSSVPLPGTYPAQGKRKARVALLIGCVQQALAPEINWATLRVLARNGVEVVIPEGQTCCGGLALHTGDHTTARTMALVNLRAFPADVDAILTNAAGCGSTLHEYPLLFHSDEFQKQAEQFSRLVADISVFLDRLEIETPPGLKEPETFVYHDACHLAHAQGITAEPRRVLAKIENLNLVSIPEAELCCGSAGAYSLEQPEISRKLGERKVNFILATGARGVITGNIGCLVQLRTHLNQAVSTNGHPATPPPVWHTVQILDRAYQGWSKNQQ
jgi:glycolate oxidase iron-sulfur subunit